MLLPNHIITHAPQAPYFKEDHVRYTGGSYMKVHREVGQLIDFYNVQFYNQGDTTYDTYAKLFKASRGYFSGTSVMEIVNRGVPMEKIVVGKPASEAAAANTGYVPENKIGNWVSRAKTEYGFETGVMYWEYFHDADGNKMKTAIGTLIP